MHKREKKKRLYTETAFLTYQSGKKSNLLCSLDHVGTGMLVRCW